MLRVISGMLKTRVEGYGSVGVKSKLVNRLRLASSKLSKLFKHMCTYMMIGEGYEEACKHKHRKRTSRQSKGARLEYIKDSRECIERILREARSNRIKGEVKPMKVVCPKCGVEGYLEKHGSKYRIRHYVGYKEGRRIYQYHYISEDQVKALGINEETGYKSCLLYTSDAADE